MVTISSRSRQRFFRQSTRPPARWSRLSCWSGYSRSGKPGLPDSASLGKGKEGKIVMKMNTYVNFRGNCTEAFRYYEKHLGAKIGMMMTHGQVPDQTGVNPDWKDAVL